jgi:uncharacterized protein (DUF4415 family)
MIEKDKSTARGWTDPDDAPDLSSAEWQARFAEAKPRLGRPKLAQTKISTTLRLDADVLNHFKGQGDGWQTRINAALRKAIDPR